MLWHFFPVIGLLLSKRHKVYWLLLLSYNSIVANIYFLEWPNFSVFVFINFVRRAKSNSHTMSIITFRIRSENSYFKWVKNDYIYVGLRLNAKDKYFQPFWSSFVLWTFLFKGKNYMVKTAAVVTNTLINRRLIFFHILFAN